MIPELAAVCPPSLASFVPGLARGSRPNQCRAGKDLRDAATLAAILAEFGRPFRGADERAILSFWTQFYFNTLIVPTATALLRLGREWPVALDDVGFSLDGTGRVERFWLGADDASVRRGAAGFDTLVQGHLVPFIDICSRHNGLSRRTLWCNAGAVLDYALAALPAPNGRDLLGRAPEADPSRRAPDPQSLLLAPYGAATDETTRIRKICCLRLKLPGIDACAGTCPLQRRIERAAAD